MQKIKQQTHIHAAVFIKKDSLLKCAEILRIRSIPTRILMPEPTLKSFRKDMVYRLKTSIGKGALIGGLITGVLFSLAAFAVFVIQGVNFVGTGFGIMITAAAFLVGTLLGMGIGSLVGIGIPQSAVKRYQQYLRNGGMVLLAKTKDSASHDMVIRTISEFQGQDLHTLSPDEFTEMVNRQSVIEPVRLTMVTEEFITIRPSARDAGHPPSMYN